MVFAPQALACVGNPNASNYHTTNGIDHGWNRVWSCTRWVYHGWTDHSHGTKYVQLYNYSTGAGKCHNFGYGSSDAYCSATATGDLIASFNDTGTAALCDMFSDGHGICAHTMEPVT